MTNEQAIKEFEEKLQYQERMLGVLESVKGMGYGDFEAGHVISIDLFKLAVQALQKQIPQSPVGEDGNQCSICWAVVEGEYDLYCPMCGQKLEVSE